MAGFLPVPGPSAGPLPRPKSWAAAAAAPPTPRTPASPLGGLGTLGAPVHPPAAGRHPAEHDKIVRLETEREKWRANLDNLLEGDFAHEDLELAVSLARWVLGLGFRVRFAYRV
jgi:hypothetical protein